MSAGAPGSRSKASTVGRSIFGASDSDGWSSSAASWASQIRVARSSQTAVVDVGLVAAAPHRRRADPVGRCRGSASRRRAGLDAVGIALQRQRPVSQVGKDRLRDPRVVVDHLAFGEAGRGPQHLVEVGELEPVPVDVYFAAFALLRDLDPALELFELGAGLGGGGRFRRLAPSRLPSRFEPAASGSPWIAARLSSRAAMRSGALVGLGSSETASTISSPRAFRSISAISSSRYSSRYLSASKSVLSDSISCWPSRARAWRASGRPRGPRPRAPPVRPPRRRTASSPWSAPGPSAGSRPGAHGFGARNAPPPPSSRRAIALTSRA